MSVQELLNSLLDLEINFTVKSEPNNILSLEIWKDESGARHSYSVMMTHELIEDSDPKVFALLIEDFVRTGQVKIGIEGFEISPIKFHYPTAPLPYDVWYERNKSELQIIWAENGADREHDFDSEKEAEKHYEHYLKQFGENPFIVSFSPDIAEVYDRLVLDECDKEISHYIENMVNMSQRRGLIEMRNGEAFARLGYDVKTDSAKFYCRFTFSVTEDMNSAEVLSFTEFTKDEYQAAMEIEDGIQGGDNIT